MTELSGYFLGMNIYDQRSNGDNQSATSPQSYPQLTPSTSQTAQNIQTVQPNYWQPPPNQIPVGN